MATGLVFDDRYLQHNTNPFRLPSGKPLPFVEPVDHPSNPRLVERTEEIQPERLPEHITNYNPERIKAEFDLPDDGLNLTSHLENLERTYVIEALKKTSGNQTRAAELLQMQVRSLRHLLDKHNIRSLSAQMRSGD